MKKNVGFLLVLLPLTCLECGKSNFLKTRSSSTNDIQKTLSTLEASLHASYGEGETPVLGEQSSDDYYLTPDYFKKLADKDRNAYLWAQDIFEGQVNIPDWSLMYKQVDDCNNVLAELAKLSPDDATQAQYNKIKGAALFMRAFCLYHIAQVFALPYDSSKAEKDPGIVIPSEDSLGVIPARSNMKNSYAKIIDDLSKAALLLSPAVPLNKDFPSRPAAYALLARVTLCMKNYDKASQYADSCLKYNSDLMNYYNDLKLDSKFPIPATNVEVLYQCSMITTSRVILGKITPGVIIDSNLYRSYSDNDLRKTIFFTTNDSGQPIFKSNYTGLSFAFSGMSIDEIYLVRAECAARQNDVPKAISLLNFLIGKRYKPGTYIPYETTNKDTALHYVLIERRKELAMRGLRWYDLRRLKEEANITLSRYIDDSIYRLSPGSNRYALPIPDDALKNGNIIQNERD